MSSLLIKPGRVRAHITAICEMHGKPPLRVSKDFIEMADVHFRAMILRTITANGSKSTLGPDVFLGIPSSVKR